MLIRREKHKAFEMPSSRKDLINDIFAQSKNIVENWALCYYCSNVLEEHETMHHWATELNNAMKVIKKQTLSKGMSKRACLQLIQGDNGAAYPDFSSWESINKFITEKLKSEEIDFSSEYLTDMFMDRVTVLLDYLAENPGQQNVYDYIKSEFGYDLGEKR